MAKRVVRLEDIEADRERRLGIDWSQARLMQPSVRRIRLGKRPVGSGLLNDAIIRRSPGSRHRGYDFVKAVYADRTGQEHM